MLSITVHKLNLGIDNLPVIDSLTPAFNRELISNENGNGVR